MFIQLLTDSPSFDQAETFSPLASDYDAVPSTAFLRIFKIILHSRMKLSLGIGQMGDETFLAPSDPVSHYSHHSQSPSDSVMRKMRHGDR